VQVRADVMLCVFTLIEMLKRLKLVMLVQKLVVEERVAGLQFA
jgi:hypothetical protein